MLSTKQRDLTLYKFTEYFEKEVLRKRPNLKKEWCIDIVGIDIDNAGQKLELNEIILTKLPMERQKMFA